MWIFFVLPLLLALAIITRSPFILFHCFAEDRFPLLGVVCGFWEQAWSDFIVLKDIIPSVSWPGIVKAALK